jgi:hypothetical protein
MVNNINNNQEFICWINKDNRILSFHLFEGAAKIQFSTKDELQNYCVHLAEYYRIQ